MSTISAGVTVPTALNLSGDTTGALTFQVSGTVTAASISATGNLSLAIGNLTFAGTGQRITGDMSNGTVSNRLLFQTSTANSTTNLGMIPNGTGTSCQVLMYNSSDVNNNSRLRLAINATEVNLISDLVGTGSYLPIVFYAGGSERMRLDTSGNLGIGNTAPSYKLQVNNASASSTADAITVQNSGVSSTGHIAGIRFRYISAEPAAIRAILTNTINGAGALGFFTSSDGTGANLVERMRVTSDGELYIAGTTDQGAYNLQVNGTGVWGAGAYVNGSDVRLKDNIQSLDSGLDVVKAMRPVTFQYKPEYSKDQSVQPGFIAQELQQAMAGKNYLDGVVQSGPEYLNVAYQNIIPILVKAMQEQQEQIKTLQDRVAELETK